MKERFDFYRLTSTLWAVVDTVDQRILRKTASGSLASEITHRLNRREQDQRELDLIAGNGWHR